MQILLNYLALGTTVITPNNRLSATLLENYFTEFGAKPIKKPQCLPYRTFLTNSYNQYIQNNDAADHPLLLTDLQSQYLWRELLQSQPDLTYSEGLLTAVMDAWNNCQLWQISAHPSAFNYTAQTEQFQTWWQLFNEKLTNLQAITEHQILDYLIRLDCSFTQQNLVWACFDSFTPQQQNLQKHLSELNFNQIFYDLPERKTECFQFSAKHSEDEREQLVCFLKKRLNLGDKRIAVVVPDLQQQAQSLQRYFLRHMPTELFNISLGKTLKDYPLVAHALQWLTLNPSTIDNHQAKLLLHSPYLTGSQSELSARTQFMQDCSLLQKPVIESKAFINALIIHSPILAKALQSLPNYPTKASPKEWVNHFKTRLDVLGFPGEYGLQSENYQCFNSFLTLLEAFTQFTIFRPIMKANQALLTLKNMAAKTIFQAQTTDKPIQVLGLLEASGCQFDSLWVMGLTDQCLPQKTRLSPFIPHELQRNNSMPHSVPTRELQLAKQVLQRLQRGSQLSVFSYPLLLADSPNLPSPLITSLTLFSPVANANQKSSLLIPFEENYHYPLQTNEKIHGGTALLANQAKCPFKAFAAHRLHAKSAPETYDGLDAKDRGQLIHTIMENVWRELGSQQNLLALSEIALDERITNAITGALAPYTLKAFIQEIEIKRLKRLVQVCLDWEKQRPDFKIETLEEAYTIQLSALTIQVRVDRLDTTADGKKWVIDYKSTLPVHKPWHEERPTEPQLLLYALLDETINTLLFLELKAGKLATCGFSEDKLEMAGIANPKKDSSWSDKRSFWEQQLNALADEFSLGFCPPQPVNSSICEHCDFQNLCRV